MKVRGLALLISLFFSPVFVISSSAQGIPEYLDLINNCRQPQYDRRLSSLGPDYFIQTIDMALSDTLIIDDYKIIISQLPLKPGSNTRFTNETFLEHIRQNFPAFIDADVALAEPYSDQDAILWKSENPVGALIKFTAYQKSPKILEIGPRQPNSPPLVKIPVDVFIVTNTKRTPLSWTLQTAHSGQLFVGNHPLSGAREWGIRVIGGTTEFYARAADRPTGVIDTVAQSLIYEGANATWTSMQKKVADFINANSGSAEIKPPFIAKKSWKNDVLAPALFRNNSNCPTTPAPRNTPLSRKIDDNQSRMAMALLSERDPTGVTRALLDVGVKHLGSRSTNQQKQIVLSDISTVAESVRKAETSKHFFDVINSEAGQRLGLSYRISQWNPASGEFSETRDPNQRQTLESMVLGNTYRPAGSSVQEMLLKSEVANGEAIALLNALIGTKQAPTINALANYIAPSGGRAIVQKLILGGVHTEISPADSKKLYDESVSLIKTRLSEAERFSSQIRNLNEFRVPNFQSLAWSARSADTIVASARTLSTLAKITGGDNQLSKDIARAQRTIESGMEMYRGLTLLAGGFSGGTMFAAVGVLSGAGGLLGNEEDSSQAEMMAALAELTEYVRKQFAIVNEKLDSIQLTLSQISKELSEVKFLSQAILTNVNNINNNINVLSLRIDKFESNITNLISGLNLSACMNYLSLSSAVPPDKSLFDDCMRKFQTIANYSPGALQYINTSTFEEDIVKAFPSKFQQDYRSAWRSANLIAHGAFFYAEHSSALAYANDENANAIASGGYTIDGVLGMIGIARRYGANWIQSNRDDYRNSFQWDHLKFKLDSIEAFRRSLLPAPPQRMMFFKNAIDKMNDVSGYPFVKSFLKARGPESVKQNIFEVWVHKLGIPNSIGILVNCNDDFSFRFCPNINIETSKLIEAGIPEIAFKFGVMGPLPPGFLIGGNRYVVNEPYFRSNNVAVRGLVHSGFHLRIENLVNRMTHRDSGDFSYPRHEVSGTLKVFQHGELLHSVDYSNAKEFIYMDPVVTDFDSLHRSVILEKLRDFYRSPTSQAENSTRTAIAEHISGFDSPLARLAMASAFFRKVGEDAGTSGQLKERFAHVDGILAFLRGYLFLAYPGLYASNDEIRGSLGGNSDVRIPDHESLITALSCASLIINFFVETESDVRVEDSSHWDTWIKSNCGGQASARVISDLWLNDFDRFFRPSLEKFNSALDKVYWETVADSDSAGAALIALRLAQMIDKGHERAFWNALR